MNALNFQSLQVSFNNIKTSIISKGVEWAGRIVVIIKLALPYLEDPRIASVTVFWVNFAILELAARVNQFVDVCFPEQSEGSSKIKLAIQVTLFGTLVAAGNIAFLKATGIKLNLFILGAIITTTFIAKYNLDSYLKHQSMVDKI